MPYYLILEYHSLRASGLEKKWTTDKEKRHKSQGLKGVEKKKGRIDLKFNLLPLINLLSLTFSFCISSIGPTQSAE